MVHVIQDRVTAEHTIRRAEISWQTRAICSFLASTVEDDKARKSLFEGAQRLTLLEDEVDDTTEERTLEDIIENGSIDAALAKNNRRKGPPIDSMRMSAP